MKKLGIVVIAMMVATMTVNAQQQFAVLDHEGTLSAYYGSSALVSALTASANGDIITLSPGIFYTGNDSYDTYTLTTAVTIRGAGCVYDSIAGTQPTEIAGTFYVNVPNDSLHCLKMEGLSVYYMYVQFFKQAQFRKCSFSTFGSQYNSSTLENATFINCTFYTLSFYSNCTNNQILNSLIYSLSSSGPGANNTFVNCYISTSGTYDLSFLSNYNIYNSILYNSYSVYNPINVQLTESIYNCIGFWENNCYANQNFFGSNINSHHLYNLHSFSGLFKTGGTYELVDSLAAIYLGNDQTPIGPHGGNFPFNRSVRHPNLGQVTSALQTRPDGKLEVEVEIISE